MSEAHLSELPRCCRWEKFSLMFSERKGSREGCFLSRARAQRQEAWEPFSSRPDKAGPASVAAVMHSKRRASSRCHPGTSRAWLTGSLWDPRTEGSGEVCCEVALRGCTKESLNGEGRHARRSWRSSKQRSAVHWGSSSARQRGRYQDFVALNRHCVLSISAGHVRPVLTISKRKNMFSFGWCTALQGNNPLHRKTLNINYSIFYNFII